VVYDSLQSAIGKPSFKALQLTPEFMKAYGEASKVGRAAMAEFPSKDMFKEIPVVISASAISEAFMVDWAIADPFSTTSQIGILDMENQAFLDKNVKLLIDSLGGLAEEQNRLVMYERQASRSGKGDPPQKGKDRFRMLNPPKQLDTMVLSQQIQEYCKSINTFAGDAVSKLYLISNKPSGIQVK
jgi:translation initiation factor 3 subunit H